VINFKLFAAALLYIEDENIEFLEPIEVIDTKKIRDFFEHELKR